MKELEGVLWIGIALFLLWLGATGRFEKVAMAIGAIREQPTNPVIKPTSTGSPVPLGMASSLYETAYNRELMGK